MVEQRRCRRFEVRLPLQFVRNGGHTPLSGETKNMSSAGVLFATEEKFEVGEQIEYTIALSRVGDVQLRCLGKVTRLNGTESAWRRPGQRFEVAATLERYEFIRKTG